MREGEGLGWPEDQTASGWDIRDVTNITKEAKWGSYLEARVAQVNRRYMGVCLTSVEPAWLTSFPHCIQSTGQVMSHLRKLHWGVADGWQMETWAAQHLGSHAISNGLFAGPTSGFSECFEGPAARVTACGVAANVGAGLSQIQFDLHRAHKQISVQIPCG